MNKIWLWHITEYPVMWCRNYNNNNNELFLLSCSLFLLTQTLNLVLVSQYASLASVSHVFVISISVVWQLLDSYKGIPISSSIYYIYMSCCIVLMLTISTSHGCSLYGHVFWMDLWKWINWNWKFIWALNIQWLYYIISVTVLRDTSHNLNMLYGNFHDPCCI
jgi:hypothetical protein